MTRWHAARTPHQAGVTHDDVRRFDAQCERRCARTRCGSAHAAGSDICCAVPTFGGRSRLLIPMLGVQPGLAGTRIGARGARRSGPRTRHGVGDVGDHLGAADRRRPGRDRRPADGYYQVRLYANECLAPWGITVVEASCQRCATPPTTPVWCSPRRRPTRGWTSSILRAGADLSPLGLIAGRRQHDRHTAGAAAASLGADVVVASGTKALGGHHDVLIGYVAGSHAAVIQRVERERLLAGTVLGAFETWLVLRSLGRVGLRFGRQCHNARRSRSCCAATRPCRRFVIPVFPTIRRTRSRRCRCDASAGW